MLDISKARFQLGWNPRLNLDQTAALTADWYMQYRNEDVYSLCVKQIEQYLQ